MFFLYIIYLYGPFPGYLGVIANFPGLLGNPPLLKGEEKSIVSNVIYIAAVKDGVIKNTPSKRLNIKGLISNSLNKPNKRRRLNPKSIKTFLNIDEANIASTDSGLLLRPIKRERT
jgi:hypothetical protein